MKKGVKKIYIGCALVSKNYEKDYLKPIKDLFQELRDRGFEVLEFKSFDDPNLSINEEIYRHDINCVENADAMLAICDHFSTGLGYELGIAIEKRGIPVLATAHENAVVSKLIQGISRPKFKFIRYQNFEEISKIFSEFISSFK